MVGNREDYYNGYYLLSQIIQAFLLVLANDLLEDRHIHDVTINHILVFYHMKQIQFCRGSVR